MTVDRCKWQLDLSQIENLDYVGFRLFAAWHGTEPDDISAVAQWNADKRLAALRGSYSRWEGVARIFVDDIKALLRTLDAMETIMLHLARYGPKHGNPSIEELVRHVAAKSEAMSPEEQKRHRDAQRIGWPRAEPGMGDERTQAEGGDPIAVSKLAIGREDRSLISKISRRAAGIFKGSTRQLRRSIAADITKCHGYNWTLDLRGLLNASPDDFNHDIFGICAHIDKDTGIIPSASRFRPHFAKSRRVTPKTNPYEGIWND